MRQPSMAILFGIPFGIMAASCDDGDGTQADRELIGAMCEIAENCDDDDDHCCSIHCDRLLVQVEPRIFYITIRIAYFWGESRRAPF